MASLTLVALPGFIIQELNVRLFRPKVVLRSLFIEKGWIIERTRGVIMSHLIFILMLLVVGILLIFTMPVIMIDLIEQHYKFAIELYRAMRETNKKVVISPISVQLKMVTCYILAEGNTKLEIANTLHLPNEIDFILEEHKRLIDYLRDPVFNLKIVEAMFIDETRNNVKNEFLEKISKYLQTDVVFVNFKRDLEGTVQVINQWVAQRTNNKIKNLVDEGEFTPNFLSRTINIAYFIEEWDSEFDEILPDSDFHNTPDNKVKVTMFFQDEMFRCKHLPELKAKILELPYDTRGLKMIAILPDEINGLTEVENKLSTLNLPEIVASFDLVTVDVTLPRFNIHKKVDTKPFLQKLGIKDLFDVEKANLKGIHEKSYYIYSLQTVVFGITETETAAAAASARYSRRNFRKEYFVADHPFIFFIYCNKVPLIIGNVNGL